MPIDVSRDTSDLIDLEARDRHAPIQAVQVTPRAASVGTGLEALNQALGNISSVVARREERQRKALEIDINREFTLGNRRDIKSFIEAYPQYAHLTRPAQMHISNLSGQDYAQRASNAFREHVVSSGQIGAQPDDSVDPNTGEVKPGLISQGRDFLNAYLKEGGAPQGDASFDDGVVAAWEPFISNMANKAVDDRIEMVKQRATEIRISALDSLWETSNNPNEILEHVRRDQFTAGAFSLSTPEYEKATIDWMEAQVTRDPESAPAILRAFVKDQAEQAKLVKEDGSSNEIFKDPGSKIRLAQLYNRALAVGQESRENTNKADKEYATAWSATAVQDVGLDLLSTDPQRRARGQEKLQKYTAETPRFADGWLAKLDVMLRSRRAAEANAVTMPESQYRAIVASAYEKSFTGEELRQRAGEMSADQYGFVSNVVQTVSKQGFSAADQQFIRRAKDLGKSIDNAQGTLSKFVNGTGVYEGKLTTLAYESLSRLQSSPEGRRLLVQNPLERAKVEKELLSSFESFAPKKLTDAAGAPRVPEPGERQKAEAAAQSAFAGKLAEIQGRAVTSFNAAAEAGDRLAADQGFVRDPGAAEVYGKPLPSSGVDPSFYADEE